MCGLAGLIHPHPESHLGPMLSSIEHRGRDDEGTYISAPFGAGQMRSSLGHRRLSIIDTSAAGHQPMLSDDGRFALILNGEIYNYRALKKELESLGVRFKSGSDTEVLLEAFRAWGVGCLDKLNGMFVFVVWDDREKRLTIARDRAGIKPVYYAKTDGGGLIFASEVKAMLASGIVTAELDFEGLDQYLTFLWTPEPHTIFKGIYKLPAGHYLTFEDGELSISEWWDASFDKIEYGRSEEDWRDETLATLRRVVDLEMVADVPLGSFLSGGVDSSAIVALMDELSGGRKITTYTVGISADDLKYDIIPDDAKWARQIARRFETDYNEIVLKPDVADLLPKLIYHTDEPIADPAIITSYLISRAAREKLAVLLSGVGGDEVFAGYPRQLAMRIASALDPVPSMIRRPLLNFAAGVLPGGLPGRFTAPLRNAKKFARSAALDFEERYLGFGTYFTAAAKQRLYTDSTREKCAQFDAYKHHRRYFEKAAAYDPLNQLLYVDFKTFLPCLNLAYTDKTAMAANLEVRVPFLNVELVEMAARMPPELKLKGLKRKYILKKAAEELLPHDAVWRKKAGFGAPVRSWLRGELRPMVEDLLSEGTVRSRGLFDPREVRRIIDANLSGREDFSLQVFQLLVLELWMREFLD